MQHTVARFDINRCSYLFSIRRYQISLLAIVCRMTLGASGDQYSKKQSKPSNLLAISRKYRVSARELLLLATR